MVVPFKELNGVQHHFFGSRVGFRLSKKTATEQRAQD